MAKKFIKTIKNWRIILLIVFLIIALIAISPKFSSDGVAITFVAKGSATDKIVSNPPTAANPTSLEVVKVLDIYPIDDEVDYYEAWDNIKTKVVNEDLTDHKINIKTNKQLYRNVPVIPIFGGDYILVNETKEINVTYKYENNESEYNDTEFVTEEVKKYSDVVDVEDLGLKIIDAPGSNLRKGIDLAGGIRVLLKPEYKLNNKNMSLVISRMNSRLNNVGLGNVVIREVNNLLGDQFILIQVTGFNEKQVIDIVSQPGHFEAKINNKTVFTGGEDIKSICTSPQCSAQYPPEKRQDGTYGVSYYFGITISQDAANRFADATKDLEIISDGAGGETLSSKIEFYLDGAFDSDLNIATSLKGEAATSVQIQGSADGNDRAEATKNAKEEIKRLQAILETGSIPVKFTIEQSNSFSPVLGKEALKNTILVALLAILAVAVVIFIRFRKWGVSLAVMGTMLAEVVLILGFASFFGWELDLVALAGIIIATGTGVDDQIVIVDEVVSGKKKYETWKQRVKKAFFIIMGAYFTTIAGMFPLFWAGAGLLRGFAFTTIVGVTMGVLITRPAFAAMVKAILKQ